MSTSEEREKARRRLRELAEIATPAPADSSGYVDLSAYSASDPNWVESALLRSKSGDTGPPSSPTPLRDLRTPGSMAPVAIGRIIESPLAPFRPSSRGGARRAQVLAYGMLAGAFASLLATAVYFYVLRVGMISGDAKRAVATPPILTAAAAIPTAPITPQSTATETAATSVSAAQAAAPSTSASATAIVPAPRSKAPLAAAPARARTVARPAAPAIPKGKSSGGDALTNAILKSIADPPAKK
jgi:hypothetical protein